MYPVLLPIPISNPHPPNWSGHPNATWLVGAAERTLMGRGNNDMLHWCVRCRQRDGGTSHIAPPDLNSYIKSMNSCPRWPKISCIWIHMFPILVWFIKKWWLVEGAVRWMADSAFTFSICALNYHGHHCRCRSRRRGWGGGWQTVTIGRAILVPNSNPHPDTFFFANFHVTAILAIST